MTESRRSCTPLFLKEEPHITGVISMDTAPFLTAAFISSGDADAACPLRYFSIRDSSKSAAASMSLSLYSATSSCMSAGISAILNLAPRVSSSQIMALLRTRSTTPLKVSSLPTGSCKTTGRDLSLSDIMPTTLKKSAPTRSILFMNAILGTWYLLACLQTVSLWCSTPPPDQNTATAPSRTRNDLSTSMVKSTWPGVSMILMRTSFQEQVVAAEVMVMPLSFSCSIQYMTAVPSWTSPIL